MWNTTYSCRYSCFVIVIPNEEIINIHSYIVNYNYSTLLYYNLDNSTNTLFSLYLLSFHFNFYSFYYEFFIFILPYSFIFHCMESQIRGPTCAQRFVNRLAQKNVPAGMAPPIV
jgi:hypothetical protein